MTGAKSWRQTPIKQQKQTPPNKQGGVGRQQHGRMFKHHTDHIRYRVLTNIGENSAQADSALNVVLSGNQENDGQMTPYSGPSVKVPRNVPSESQGVNTPSDQSSVATASHTDEECLSEELKSSTGASYTDGQINVSHSPAATRRDSSRLSLAQLWYAHALTAQHMVTTLQRFAIFLHVLTHAHVTICKLSGICAFVPRLIRTYLITLGYLLLSENGTLF